MGNKRGKKLKRDGTLLADCGSLLLVFRRRKADTRNHYKLWNISWLQRLMPQAPQFLL